MTEWLLSIVGVVFIGVLFDLIYPNGKTNTFCKCIFGVLSVIIIINPILKIDFSISQDSYIDSSLLENINETKCESLKNQIVSYLKLKNIDGVSVEIEINMDNNEFEIENIFIDTSELVLTENLTNINKYEVISNEVASIVQVDMERIIVYG